MKVTGIETLALRDPGKASETLVRVHTDEGVTGIGQADAPSLVIDGLIRCEGGLEEIARGEDPVQVERLWQKMYALTGVWGRRGAAIAAIGAVETALWDIAGKALERPVSELIASAPSINQEYSSIDSLSIRGYRDLKRRVAPYATIYPPGAAPGELRDRFRRAAESGFQAVKLEAWPGVFGHGSPGDDAASVRLVREAVGRERRLMVDVCNHWQNVAEAVGSIRAIEPYGIYFVEAPLPADHLEAHARLADAVETPIAAGDWGFSTRYEFEDLMDRGRVDVVQPSSVRAGGVGEIVRIAGAAFRRGLLCIPHAWCHMVGVAAEVQLATVLPNMPYIEYPLASPDSPIVSSLLDPPLVPDKEGFIEVPRGPGLGVSLNEKVVERFRVKPF